MRISTFIISIVLLVLGAMFIEHYVNTLNQLNSMVVHDELVNSLFE